MDEIIIRSLRGEATEAEESELRQWRRTSITNEKYYRELARLWKLSGGAERTADPRPIPTAAALLRQAGSANRRAPRVWSGPVARWVPRALGAAACIALGFLLGPLLRGERPAAEFGASEFVTGEAEMATARLADGTVVRLGPNSRLRVTGSPDSRDVWLDGRAFFAVARDEARRFTVRTRAGEALVLGTRFEVSVLNTDMRVVVVEGRVAHAAAGTTVEIGAGEVSQTIEGNPPAVERVENVHPMLDWMGRFLVFESTPLRDAAKEIEQRYDLRVHLPDSILAERTVSAWFTEQSVEEVIAVICRIVDAHCSVTDTVVSIEP